MFTLSFYAPLACSLLLNFDFDLSLYSSAPSPIAHHPDLAAYCHTHLRIHYQRDPSQSSTVVATATATVMVLVWVQLQVPVFHVIVSWYSTVDTVCTCYL
jgi:hypothetical protein